MAPNEPLPHDDPGLEGGEWLFRRDGQVFGPIDSRALAAMLYRGEIEGRTLVSTGDGNWRPVAEVAEFLVHAKKAKAALRVEREVTGARLLRARRNKRRAVVIALGAVLIVAVSVGGALHLARRSRATSPLLEDFGAGLRIASAARVGVTARAAAEDEIEVPVDAPVGHGAAPRRRPARAPAAAGSVDGGELVAAQFDGRRIQAVVGREQRSLVPCFRDEAGRSPDFRGDVPIEFTIGNDGRVGQLWIDEPRFRDGALRDCLARALAGWRFDPFPGQRPTVSLAFGMGR
jgi:hypothetical protein